MWFREIHSRTILASPPQYYVLHNCNVALLFFSAVMIGIAVALMAKRKITRNVFAASVMAAIAVIFLLLDQDQIFRIIAKRDALNYLTWNITLLFVSSVTLTWLTCFSYERRKMREHALRRNDKSGGSARQMKSGEGSE
jgi:hypothetical protein